MLKLQSFCLQGIVGLLLCNSNDSDMSWPALSHSDIHVQVVAADGQINQLTVVHTSGKEETVHLQSLCLSLCCCMLSAFILCLWPLSLHLPVPYTLPLYLSPVAVYSFPLTAHILTPYSEQRSSVQERSQKIKPFKFSMLRSCWTIQVMVAMGLHCTGAVLQMLFTLSSNTELQVTVAVCQAALHKGLQRQSYEVFSNAAVWLLLCNMVSSYLFARKHDTSRSYL